MDYSFPKWMTKVLQAAAVYNVLWGAWVVLLPNTFFQWTGMEPLTHPTVWQGTGMIVGVSGLGYWWAACDPIRHWPIVAVGFLGKVFGPLGFVFNHFVLGEVPFEFSYTMVTNDVIWWVPFFLILQHVYRSTRFKLLD